MGVHTAADQARDDALVSLQEAVEALHAARLLLKKAENPDTWGGEEWGDPYRELLRAAHLHCYLQAEALEALKRKLG